MTRRAAPGPARPGGRAAARHAGLVERISVSMNPALLQELDTMVASRGFESRSQAISDMVNQQLVEHQRELGNAVMVGTITLFYDRATPGLQRRLSDLQTTHIAEVISSLHVHLAEAKMMEVILVQGPAPRLQGIADAMRALKGVISARLQLMAAAIPPIHPSTAPVVAAGAARATTRATARTSARAPARARR